MVRHPGCVNEDSLVVSSGTRYRLRNRRSCFLRSLKWAQIHFDDRERYIRSRARGLVRPAATRLSASVQFDGPDHRADEHGHGATGPNPVRVTIGLDTTEGES